MGAYLWIVLLFMLLVTGSGFAQEPPGFIRMVQVMEDKKTGLSGPSGVVFSSRANQFYVVESPGNDHVLPDIAIIKNISVFGHRAGSTPIKIGIENPINIAMDNRYGRLLIYQATTQQLIEVRENSSGVLDPNSLTHYDASYIGLQDPQGMTFDPILGYLYFLDEVGPRLVRIKPQSNGSFTSGTIDEINLAWAGNIGLRGIAFDPTSGNFHVVSPNEQILYEFSISGEMASIRDLSEFYLSNPQSIVIAPSGDQTDNSELTSLYLADRGTLENTRSGILSSGGTKTINTPGKLVELSLQPIEQIDATFQSALLRMTNMASFSPPSPDPSGLTYLSSSNTLLMSDGEVEETVSGITHFMGGNLWEMTLNGTIVRTANISPIPPTLVSMSDEPTGVTWNPGNGHYYFSDDNEVGVFDLNPGIDGLIGTTDDSWTSFSTIGVGNGDPEGIAYDTWNDKIFVVDGVNNEIYQYTPSGNLLSQFDVQIYGISDPESVEFNQVSNTLFILGSNRIIVETTTAGSLLQTIDVSTSSALAPAGLAYAPASDGSGLKHFYIVDRGVDNNNDPNIIDGKMYEMTAPVPITPGNIPPVVNAGLDQTIVFGTTANLNGIASDDGLPNPPGTLTSLWSVISGPGNVTIANPSALGTTASFSVPGIYVLRLTTRDSELSSYDEINLTVSRSEGSTILDVQVGTSSDDAEESSSGYVNRTSTDLELVYDGNNQTVGLRFIGLMIPNNALIDYAYVQFQVDEVNSEVTSLSVWGEDQDNPGTFTATTWNISSRLKTSAAVSWSPPPWTVVNQAGVDQRTPNIATIIQEIVNRPGWSAGNSLVVIIGGTGHRTAKAYESAPTAAPVLHIEFAGPASTTPTLTITPTITPTSTLVPTNTSTPTPSRTPTNTSTFTPSNTPLPTNTSTSTLTPSITPTQTASPTSTSTRTPKRSPTSTLMPTNTLTSTPSNTLTPTSTSTLTLTPFTTPTNTPSPTNTLTSTPGYTSTSTPLPTNTLTSTSTNTPLPTNTSTPSPTSSNTPTITPLPTDTLTPTPSNTPTDTPLPTNTPTPTPSPTPAGPTTLEVRVSSSSDDAEESASGSVSFTDMYLELVYDASNQIVGIRFRSLSIPQGATILNAYVQFQTASINTDVTSLTIQGQANDNASSFNRSKRSISSRVKTVASVGWSPVAWNMINEAGQNQRTPDISAVIQEIVKRPAWLSGNSLVLIITGSGQRTAWSYNGLSSGAPVLHVEFLAP